MKQGLAMVAVATVVACLSPGGSGTMSTTPSAASRDSSRLLVPAGYGSLKQDDIAIRVGRGGLQVQAIPLDETIIRVLSPDSYRALREQLSSRLTAIDSLGRRMGLGEFSVWMVRFHGLVQGETPFSPMEFIVLRVGRQANSFELREDAAPRGAYVGGGF